MNEISSNGAAEEGPDGWLRQAMQRHRAGALDEAERLYRAVLASARS